MDNCKAHWDSKNLEIKKLLNKYRFDVVLFPPNSTSFL